MNKQKIFDASPTNTTPIKDFFAYIADWLNGSGCILKVILQFLPGLWSPVILNIFSGQLTTNGKLNSWGWIGAFFIYGTALIVTILTAYKSARDEKRKKLSASITTALKAEIALRKAVVTAENTVEGKRVRRLKEKAFSAIKSNFPPPRIISDAFNPREHIHSILDELGECFSKVTELTKESIHISAAYCIEGNSWTWLASLSNEDVASISDLLTNSSAFRIVMNGQSYFYSNDKREAAANGQYFFDSRDQSKGNEGSIICWKIASSFKGAPSIQMIISISTYGHRFIESKDTPKDVVDRFYIDKIRDVILQQFENELVEGLLLFQLSLLDKSSN